MTDWEWLVKRYANGRSLCNCQQAYSGLVEGYVNGRFGRYIGCPNGCSANQLDAKEHVAKAIRGADAMCEELRHTVSVKR